MKVATKFSLAFLACGVFSVLVYSAVAASREVARLDATVMEDLASLGRIIGRSVMEVWDKQGEERARDLVAYADRDETIEARWTWLDAPKGSSTAPRADPVVVDAVKRGVASTWIAPRPDGTRAIYAYVPLLKHGERPAALEISRPVLDEKSVFLAEIREELLASTGVVALATLVALLLTQVIVSRPLARVAAQARRIGTGDLSHRIPERGRDEVASLVRDLNAMCDQIDEARSKAKKEAQKSITALEQLRHADRLRTVGTLASGIAHEVGTPLNVIMMRAKMIASGEAAEGVPASAKIIAGQAERVAKIIRQLLDFARRRAPDRSDADLLELAERTATLLSGLAKKAKVAIEVEREEGKAVRAKVDAAQLEQALTNLVINAVHAMPDGGRVVISARRELSAPPEAPDLPRECALVEVRDEGVGIEPDHLSRIFEPFFTTKDVGEGTGLGLSVTHGIIQDHEGWMTAMSEVGRGSIFTLHLPVEVR